MHPRNPPAPRLYDDAQNAADLFGEAWPEAIHQSGEDSGGPEPFFGDRHDQCWKVVARGGSRMSRGLRNDDLIVERATVNGNTS